MRHILYPCIDLVNVQCFDRLFVRILSVCLCDHLSVSPSVFHSIRRPVSQSASPSVCQSVSRSILLSVIPPVPDRCSRPTAKHHLCLSFLSLLPNFIWQSDSLQSVNCRYVNISFKQSFNLSFRKFRQPVSPSALTRQFVMRKSTTSVSGVAVCQPIIPSFPFP